MVKNIRNTQMRCLFIAAIFLLQASPSTFAQDKCAKTYQKFTEDSYLSRPYSGPPELEEYNGELSAAKLKAAGYRVTKENVLEKSQVDGSWLPMGKLKVLRTKYLFEWAGEDVHSYLSKYGADQRFMDNSLDAPAQLAGKGFYVSSHPFNSQNFGGFVTTFLPEKPIVLLELSNLQHGSDTNLLKKFASVEIDGLRTVGYFDSWMSMIRGSNLHRTIDPPEDVLSWVFKPEGLSSMPGVGVNSVYLNRWSELLKKDKTHLKIARAAKNAKSEDQVLEAVRQVREGNFLTLSTIDKLKRSLTISAEATRQEKIYDAILSSYDIKDILWASKEPSALGDHFSRWKKEASQYLSGMKKVDLTKIETADDLINAYKKIYGEEIKFRNTTVVMTKEGNPELTLPTKLVERLQNQSTLKVFTAPKQPTDSAFRRVAIAYHIPASHEFLTATHKNIISRGLYESTRTKQLADGSLDLNDPSTWEAAKAIYKNYIDEYFHYNGLRSLHTSQQLLDGYVAFMQYHPFADGNGRMGRLFYEVLERKANFPYDGARPAGGLTLPIFDMDLFGKPEELNKSLGVGAILKAWIRQAKSDEEFIQRVQTAANVLKKSDPEITQIFPELLP